MDSAETDTRVPGSDQCSEQSGNPAERETGEQVTPGRESVPDGSGGARPGTRLEAPAHLQEDQAVPWITGTRPYGVEGKGFGIRAGAYLIDFVTLYALNAVVGSLSVACVGIVLILCGVRVNPDAEAVKHADYISGLLLSVIYFTLFESLYGASIGKAILKLRVVRANGRPCSLWAAFLRALLRFVDGFLFGLPAYLSMKPALQQRLGDRAAGTLVVSSGDAYIEKKRSWWWFVVAAVVYVAVAAIVSLLVLYTTLR